MLSIFLTVGAHVVLWFRSILVFEMTDDAFAWGVLAPNCASLRPFLRACAGCTVSVSVALLDESSDARGRRSRCPGSPSAIFSWVELLPSWVYSVSNFTVNRSADAAAWGWSAVTAPSTGDFNIRFYKTRLLAELMLREAPRAQWLLKADLDAWVNLSRLRHVLSLHWQRPPAAEYMGRVVQTWSLRGTPFPFVQGGAIVFSRRAAQALARCVSPLGNASRCPNSVLQKRVGVVGGEDHARRNEQMRRDGCFSARTTPYNDDMYVGICMHTAGVPASSEPCVLSHPPMPKVHRRQLPRCGCPISEHSLKESLEGGRDVLLKAREGHLECCKRIERSMLGHNDADRRRDRGPHTREPVASARLKMTDGVFTRKESRGAKTAWQRHCSNLTYMTYGHRALHSDQASHKEQQELRSTRRRRPSIGALTLSFAGDARTGGPGVTAARLQKEVWFGRQLAAVMKHRWMNGTCVEPDEPGRWHSDFRQDATVAALLAGQRGGFFVDLAANDPVCYSNTRALERDYDWHGVCIDGNPALLPALRSLRSCTVVGAIISDESGTVAEFETDTWSGTSRIAALRGEASWNASAAPAASAASAASAPCPSAASAPCPSVASGPRVRTPSRHPSRHKPAGTITMRTRTLREVLESTRAPTVVDYLSLDVEGYEEQALASRGGLFERYTFRVMTIERPSPTLRRRLQAHGYLYVSYKLGCYDQLWVHQSMEQAVRERLHKTASSNHSAMTPQERLGQPGCRRISHGGCCRP